MDLEGRVAELEALVAELVGQLQTANKRIVELEESLEEARRAGKRQAAPFSKRPPKSDPKRPGRKSGKAHGRHGHRQDPERVDVEHDAPIDSENCECGGHIDIDGHEMQYVTDLPPVRPVVTAFRVQIGRCDTCGRRHQGRHHAQISDALGAAGSMIGPRAKAWAVMLHYRMGLSFGRCAEVLAELGIDITPGAIAQAAARMGNDLETVYDQILDRLNTSRTVTMDETGWHVGGHSWWLWTATNADATAYVIAQGRGSTQSKDLIDLNYQGILIRDGWPAYSRYTKATHQTCLAHLLRRCHDMANDLPETEQLTPTIVAALLRTALDARDLPPDQRKQVATHLQDRLAHLRQQPQTHPDNQRLLDHLTHQADATFTFLTHDCDATNYRAEQAIRPAVINRKTWGGNRTPKGATTQQRLTSIITTARQHGHNILDYLTTPTPLWTPR